MGGKGRERERGGGEERSVLFVSFRVFVLIYLSRVRATVDSKGHIPSSYSTLQTFLLSYSLL